MVNTIAPVWDSNETWLVFGGGGLFAMFPLAYAVIFPAMYPTIIGMLLALIFRGVAFEFRFRANTASGRRAWDLAFLTGSIVAALCQGMTLGGLLQGIYVVNRQYAGGWLDWLDAFTALCGIALVVGYALQGACWLILRTEGRLQHSSRRNASMLGLALLALIFVISLWTPMLNEVYWKHWFIYPQVLFTAPVPILVVLVAWVFWRALKWHHDITPFLCAQAWFLLCYAGLGISIWPMIVPPSISIWEAAAPPASQLFLLAGAVVLIPMILGYNSFSYWTFRGKVRPGENYQ
jgi:cytochrome d ubiquinol oxidase subunit II